MKDYFYLKSQKNRNMYIFLLKFIIFLYKIDPILLGAGIYTPTDIEKAQNLTRISKYSDIIINYATLATTLNGDLICISSPYSGYTYYYYGLKKMEDHIF